MKRMTCYNNGFVFVYQDDRELGSFGAKKNIDNLEELTFISKLAYVEMGKREEDIELLQSQNRNLSLKIKCPLCPTVQNKHKVVINNTIYDIVNIDISRMERAMYIYLEEVMTLDNTR